MIATTDPAGLVPVKIRDHAQLARHEAGHCAGAMLAGLSVRHVQAPRRGPHELEHGVSADRLGRVVTEPCDLRRAHAIFSLCGPLYEGGKAPPPWPIPEAPPSDDEGISKIVEDLGLDRQGYHELVSDTLDLARSPLFRKLAGLIADRLEELEEIGAEELDRLRAIAEEDTMADDEFEFETDSELDAELERFKRKAYEEMRVAMGAPAVSATAKAAAAARAQPVRVTVFAA